MAEQHGVSVASLPFDPPALQGQRQSSSWVTKSHCLLLQTATWSGSKPVKLCQKN